jgi:hypothetical protein
MSDDPTYPPIWDARPEPRPPLSAQEIDPTRLPADLRSDAICTIAWVNDGFQAVQLFINPVLMDRAEDLCETAQIWTSVHRDVDSLSRAILEYARAEGLSASIHEQPPGDLSVGLLAVSFEIG